MFLVDLEVFVQIFFPLYLGSKHQCWSQICFVWDFFFFSEMNHATKARAKYSEDDKHVQYETNGSAGYKK